jgi:hypothetical protein
MINIPDYTAIAREMRVPNVMGFVHFAVENIFARHALKPVSEPVLPAYPLGFGQLTR